MENLELILSVLTLMVVGSAIAVAVMMFITEGKNAFTPLIEEWCNSKGLVSLVITIAIMSIMINLQTTIVVAAIVTVAMTLGFKVKGDGHVSN